jgi:hypothetical protein
MMLVVVSIAVALVAFILYALERRSKEEPIVWSDALKFSLFGGLTSAGIVFATSAESSVPELPAIAAVQEMFVGSPSF